MSKMKGLITEMQIRTTMIHFFTHATMAILKKTITSVGEDAEKRESLCTVCRNVIGAASMENSMEVPKNT